MRIGGPATDALQHANYRMLAGSQLVSALGDGVALVAVTYALLESTSSLSALGWVLGARYGCLGVFILVGGVLGDRVPRVPVLVASDLLRCAAQAGTAVALMVGHPPAWIFIMLQGLYGTGEAFFSPSVRGLVPQLVPKAHLQAANAISEAILNVSRVLGPALGGVLVIGSGAKGAIAIDALSFVSSAWLISRIRLRPVHIQMNLRPVRLTWPRGFRRDLVEGWVVVRRSQWLWSCIATFTIYGALTFPGMMVLGPAASWRGLGGVSGWTAFTTALGAGALVGGLLSIRVPIRRPGIVLMTALAVAAVRPATFVAGWSAPEVAAYSFLAGAAMSLAGVTWYTALQERLPGSVLSRVSAIDDFGTYLLTPAGYFLAAPLAAAIGLDSTMLALAVIPTAAALATACLPQVRRLRNSKIEAERLSAPTGKAS